MLSGEWQHLRDLKRCLRLHGLGRKAPHGQKRHKSAYHGLILNHLEPVYVFPSYLEGPGISGGICPSDVRRILEQDKKREIQAVLVVSPTYGRRCIGHCGDRGQRPMSMGFR